MKQIICLLFLLLLLFSLDFYFVYYILFLKLHSGSHVLQLQRKKNRIS